MRKLYNEFFYIPKHGKIREKVMLARVAKTVVIMVICLLAMSITAYAYFSHNITSGSNIIKAADFEIAVTVQITDNGKAVDNSKITTITSDNKNFVISGLEVGEWYTITIEPSLRNTAQTGFVIVSAEGCETTYHTEQLGVDEGVSGGKTSKLRFEVRITDTTDVVLKSHWGTSSFYSAYKIKDIDDERYIIFDEKIKMIVNGHINPNIRKDNADNGSEATTTPSTDVTIPTTENESTTPNTEPTTPTTETESSASDTEPTTLEENTSETIGTSEPTSTPEPSDSETESTTQTTEPAATEPPSTEENTENPPATEITEPIDTPNTEASE